MLCPPLFAGPRHGQETPASIHGGSLLRFHGLPALPHWATALTASPAEQIDGPWTFKTDLPAPSSTSLGSLSRAEASETEHFSPGLVCDQDFNVK